MGQETPGLRTRKRQGGADALYWCAIVEAESSTGAEPMIASALGIGRGCCSDDPTPTPEPSHD